MDNVLAHLINKIDEYVGGLIDIADMPAEDKAALKQHLLAAQEILARNGKSKLEELVNGITGAILSRF